MENIKDHEIFLNQLKDVLQSLALNTENSTPTQDTKDVDIDNNNDQDNLSTPSSNFSNNDECFMKFAEKYIDFTYNNPTTFHVIKFAAKLLEEHGFKYLVEKDSWDDKFTFGKYYTIRNGTNLVAFIVGKDWEFKNGVGAIASHVDSLTAKLKPASIKDNIEGFQLLGVAPYGGTLNHVWFDRDLGIGGKILYRDGGSDDDKIKDTLIDSTPYPIATIPTLAPHFGSPALGPFNREDQAVPILGYCNEDTYENDITDDEKKSPLYKKHSIHLLRYVARLANVKVSQLLQIDLDLFDVQKGTLGGLNKDFVFAPRLDDRLCSFAGLWAMALYGENIDCEKLNTFSVLGLFDNEEVGSLSRQGAKGGLLESTIARAAYAHSYVNFNELHTLFANSIILSADVNHMFNPNFANVYMKNHSPKPNVGVTLSLDPNAHMATDVVGFAFIEELARRNDDKIQYFQIKNDSRSGGTIGPSLAAQTGARTIDLGIAQLAMHSIRAATGSKDIGLGIKFFKGFYENWRSTYDKFGEL